MIHILWLIDLHIFLFKFRIFKIETKMLHCETVQIRHILVSIEVSTLITAEATYFSTSVKVKFAISVAPSLLVKIIQFDL